MNPTKKTSRNFLISTSRKVLCMRTKIFAFYYIYEMLWQVSKAPFYSTKYHLGPLASTAKCQTKYQFKIVRITGTLLLLVIRDIRNSDAAFHEAKVYYTSSSEICTNIFASSSRCHRPWRWPDRSNAEALPG